MIVIDASAAIAMCLDEREHLASDTTFESLAEHELLVPSHWHAEIGNALVINMRRGRLTPERLIYALDNLSALRVTTHAIPDVSDIATTIEHAVQSGLTYYDELYVRLAEMKSVAIFTLDQQMRSAGKLRGIVIFPT